MVEHLETLFYERLEGAVVVVTLNRPDRGNGVVPELARDLLAVLTLLEGDTSVRAVVLTGQVGSFQPAPI